MTKHPDQTHLARDLRRRQTEAEKVLWSRLRDSRGLGVKFRRQQPIGPYVVDFVSLKERMVIEVDGGQHGEPASNHRDEERTAWLTSNGYRVLRFWNNEVLTNAQGVLERILDALGERSPYPSPLKGAGGQQSIERDTMKLIFIHGSGGCGDAWHFQKSRFPTADAVSLPGHPDGEARTSIEGYVEWLRDYVRQKGYRDVVLAGHSLGSAIAQLYALDHPDELKGLILIGAGARLRVHPMYIEALEKAKADPSVMETMTQTDAGLVEPEYDEMMRQRSLEIGPAVFLNDMLCCDRFDVMGRVHEIELPTLIVCGTEDAMTPPKYARYLADRIEGAREVIIPGGTHRVYAEKPAEVNRAIDEFLRSLPP